MKSIYFKICHSLVFIVFILPEISGAEEPISIKSFALEGWAYGTQTVLQKDSILNPDNKTLRLKDREVSAVAKLNLVLLAPQSEITFRSNLMEKQSNSSPDQSRDFTGIFNQGYIRTNLTNNFSSTVGREILTWGPANFRSPSNPFYFDAGKTDPLRDLIGLDLAKVFYKNENLGVSIGYIGGSDKTFSPDDFSKTILIKIDMKTQESQASLIASKTPNLAAFLGGFAQRQMSDNFMIYSEFGFKNQQYSLDVLPASLATSQSSQKKILSLVGAAYTVESGHTLSFEYLHNGFGLDSETYTRYFNIIETANRQFIAATSRQTLGINQQTLVNAATLAPSPLAKNYLFFQLQSNPLEGASYWRYMSAINLHDKSSQHSIYTEKSLSNKISLFGVVSRNFGNRRTEYGLLTNSTIMAGLKLYLF